MQLGQETYRSKIITGFCIIFYVLMLYKWCNGMFLYQMQPFFFTVREDVVTWFFMLSGLQVKILASPSLCCIMDMLFYVFPLLLLLTYKLKIKWMPIVAIAMLIVNWMYVQCYTLFPTNSIEAHVVWLLFPVVFIPRKLRLFKLLMEGLRYFFLFFFASAGIWKIVQGGLFNVNQMSLVLLTQHKELLAFSSGNWFTQLIIYLVNHPVVSQSLYVLATILELMFVVGFFTRKYDKWLLIAFLGFLVFDHFLMRIPYYEVLPFLLTLYYNVDGKYLLTKKLNDEKGLFS